MEEVGFGFLDTLFGVTDCEGEVCDVKTKDLWGGASGKVGIVGAIVNLKAALGASANCCDD